MMKLKQHPGIFTFDLSRHPSAFSESLSVARELPNFGNFDPLLIYKIIKITHHL